MNDLTRFAKATAVGEARATAPTTEQLAAINALTRREFSADELYVGLIDLANDKVDRTFERFTPKILRQFADSAPGSSLLIGHDYESAPVGMFFDAKVVKQDATNWLRCWYYMPKVASTQHVRDMIDAGVYRYASIGFGRADPTDKTPDPQLDLFCDICGGNWSKWWKEGGCTEHFPGMSYDIGNDKVVCTLHYEGQARMVEGSIVFLGAQFGAEAKAADAIAAEYSETVTEMAEQLAFASAARFTKSFEGVMVPRRRPQKAAESPGEPMEPPVETAPVVPVAEKAENGPQTTDPPEPERKSGRVLSKTNENKLQQAADLIVGVLAAVKKDESAEDDAGDEKDGEKAPAEPESQDVETETTEADPGPTPEPDPDPPLNQKTELAINDLAEAIVRGKLREITADLTERIGANAQG